MKHPMRYLTIAGLVVALSACGAIVAGLIPDQEIDDAFGLDGTEVTASAAGAAGATATLATSQLTGSFSATVDSDGLDDFPAIVRDAARAASISDVLTIRTTVEVSAPGNVAFEGSYTITGVSLRFEVFDGATSVLSQDWSNDALSLTFTGSAAFDGSDTRGTYSAEVDVPMITLTLTSNQASAYFDLLKEPGTYTLTGSITLEVEPAFPADADMTFTLKSLGGELTF